MTYKYVGEDDDTFKVQHPDGTEFSIAKSAIGPGVHERIKSLDPFKADEPTVELAGAPMEAAAPEFKPQETTEAPPMVGDLGQYFQQPQAAPTQPILSGQNPPIVPGVSSAVPSLMPAQENALAAQESGIKNIAATQAQTYQDISKVQQGMATQAATIDAELKAHTAPLEAENQNLFNSIKDAKIDANRLWHTMGTGNKILAAISIGLSGLGAGLQGPGAKNMALEVIDKSIDRDIDAQKADLGKKQTLFSDNLRRLGDARSAAAATKMQLLTVAQAQISSLMSKAKSIEDLNRGKMGLAEIELKKAELGRQVGLTNLAKNIGQANDAQVQLLPKEVRERAVKIGGKYTLALDDNSAKEARGIVGANDALITGLDKLIELREKFGSETIPGPAKAEMQTIATSIQLAIKEAKKLGTLDRGAEKFMEKLVSDPTSFGYVLDNYKALRSSQLREAAQRLKSLGVDPGDMGAEIKTKDGVQYKKVPGGWQRI